MLLSAFFLSAVAPVPNKLKHDTACVCVIVQRNCGKASIRGIDSHGGMRCQEFDGQLKRFSIPISSVFPACQSGRWPADFTRHCQQFTRIWRVLISDPAVNVAVHCVYSLDCLSEEMLQLLKTQAKFPSLARHLPIKVKCVSPEVSHNFGTGSLKVGC